MKFFNKTILFVFGTLCVFYSCEIDDYQGGNNTNTLTFNKIGGFINGTGDEGFAEISAFDPKTAKLFVVNPNDAELSVWDLSDPYSPTSGSDILLNGIPNSVAAHNGLIAVALENAANKQADGTIATYDSTSQTLLATYTAGALPDMVTFSPDGKYIVAANEGEPNDDYTNDPEGSITVIEVATGEITQISFSGYNNIMNDNHLRIFGPGAGFAQDIEPEYIAISDDSKTAYIVLQENNGMATIDLTTKTILNVSGFGVKDYSLPSNQIDASDKDNIVGNFQNWPVLSFYQPDAITYVTVKGVPILITANEGDARDYDGYSEEKRVKDLILDPTIYPNAATLQLDENLGRLKVTTANGDIDGDGDIDQIYTYGGRSFTVWSTTGNKIYDSGDHIAKTVMALEPSAFNSNGNDSADNRSDDKGAEPESVATLTIDNNTFLFVGLERTGGIMVYDMDNAHNPRFVTWLRDSSDISPEGLITVDASDSPTGNALVIATHEVSNSVAIYEVK